MSVPLYKVNSWLHQSPPHCGFGLIHIVGSFRNSEHPSRIVGPYAACAITVQIDFSRHHIYSVDIVASVDCESDTEYIPSRLVDNDVHAAAAVVSSRYSQSVNTRVVSMDCIVEPYLVAVPTVVGVVVLNLNQPPLAAVST